MLRHRLRLVERPFTRNLRDKRANFDLSPQAGRGKGRATCDSPVIDGGDMEDQDELAEVAPEIEARRGGIYVLSDDERVALEEALQSGVASGEEVAAFWKRYGIG
jgi:hypothetical protein